mmetsp:Transcript_23845/g.52153  ORF Transcript_23845/g.52153 Transcript_23845/m.52153 type:complete len:430 (+) Transcript_23845:95-1384(+)
MITSSLPADCGKKRKREAVRNALDGTECNKDETALVETSIAADCAMPLSSSSLSMKPICFLEFRLSTINQYPSLTWLGPAVMAVYWFKEYLNKPSFGWVRLPKEKQPSLTPSSSSSSSFFSIPKCRGLFCYRVDRNHVLIGGALTDGGSIVEWASRFLNLDKDKRAFQKCLEETKGLVKAEYEYEMRTTKQQLTHRDLIMAPFLSGERSTGFRDGAAGAIFGLTRETTPAHFFKASLEAVSLRLKAVLDLLLLTGQDGNKRITTCGKGGNREDYAPESTTTENPIAARLPLVVASGKAMEVNHLWRQMIADSSGLSVVLDEDTAEGTSRGVARLVAMSLLAETKAASPGETTNASGTKPSSDCDNETTALKTTVESQKKPQSLVYAQYEEELNLYVISKPRPTATAMYARKSRVQEGFIDSISPFFAST